MEHPKVQLIYPVKLHLKKLFLFTWLSIRESFLVRDQSWSPLPVLSIGILFGLDLCRFCAYCQTLCEFVCMSALLWLENKFFLASPIHFDLYKFPSPLSQSSLSSEDWVLHSLSFYTHCPVVSLCLSSDLLPEEALMVFEIDTSLDYSKMSLGIILPLHSFRKSF